jgi:sterol desaturase/sphingolipid hydroxylase (fatty acid hydroxylase superfamily)
MHLCEAVVGAAASVWWAEAAVATITFAIAMRFFRALEPQKPARWWSPSSGTTWLRRSVSALVAYWAFVAAWVRVVPPRAPAYSSGCPHNIHSLARLLVELVSGVVAYDFAFFWLHLLMHRSPTVYRLLQHSRHHENHVGGRLDETALRTINHSLVDGGLQVLTNILVQRCVGPFGPRSTLARLLHNVVVVGMLVESHTSAGAPRIARRLWCCDGVRKHHEHHRTAGAPFQQFFGYLDAGLLALLPTAAVDARRAAAGLTG